MCTPSGQLVVVETTLLQSLNKRTLANGDGGLRFCKVCKEAAVLEIPYLIPISPPIATGIFRGRILASIVSTLSKESGLRHLKRMANWLPYQLTNSTRPVAEQDMKG